MPDDLAPYAFLGGVNRSAVTITPRELYVAWARAVFAHEADPPTEVSTAPVTLLIPESDETEAMSFMQETSSTVFCEMLTRWCCDVSKWPEGVGEWATFTAWFEVKFSDDVFDLDDEELESYPADDEEDDEELDEDEKDPRDAAWLTEVMELRIREDLYNLLRALLWESPAPSPGLIAALDEAASHRKGRVVRAEQRVWSSFLHLLGVGAGSADFMRAKLSRELSALISESRGRKW
jgi:hypothetical protein